ncbi:MAG: nicotinamide mononucleotide transporter [Planctomycetes bacterium]|nr:nicotinamide mononucleotide transporter [Planctomycetota bacterium]
MTLLFWLTAVASLTGVVLNIHGRRACFAIWAVTNAIWSIADWIHDLPAQSALQATYVALAIYGLARWKSKRPVAT